jgi:hypothetical protein
MGRRESNYGASHAAAVGRKRDNRETQCSLCKRSIYANQPREWVHGEVIGLVHVDCLNPRE